jgi:hypothetical protein
MTDSLSDYLRDVTAYQRFLYGVAALLMVSAIVHAAVWLADGGAWEGPVSWRKPILFSFSFGITSASLRPAHP